MNIWFQKLSGLYRKKISKNCSAFTTEQKRITFGDLKEDILIKINSPENEFKLEEPTTLFPGFINPPFCTELTGQTMIGGPTVPMIMLVGDKTGRIYLFALKAVLKDLD